MYRASLGSLHLCDFSVAAFFSFPFLPSISFPFLSLLFVVLPEAESLSPSHAYSQTGIVLIRCLTLASTLQTTTLTLPSLSFNLHNPFLSPFTFLSLFHRI